jgi:predicted amidohydrolase
MRIALAELAPVPGDVERNVARVAEVVRAARAEVVAFPELYLSGYRIGDRFQRIALTLQDRSSETLRSVARSERTTILVGAPVVSSERPGEVCNAALAVTPDAPIFVQVKRYLPTFGPFEEGVLFTPTDSSRPVPVDGRPVGLEICYDVFFPEVSRQLALAGAELLVNLSASPVTSRRLFEKLLPARAVENAFPVVYVNRVGVEDGVVFGGGSGAWDARGEPIPVTPVPFPSLGPDERLVAVEIDPGESARWRPFRPVLRDVASRPGLASSPSS